jgi:2-polyprenyl-6-methoxyphenol hydroxylase-like FAD-dependent oxidoreductase
MQQPSKYLAGTKKTGDRTVFQLAPNSDAAEEQKECNVRKRLQVPAVLELLVCSPTSRILHFVSSNSPAQNLIGQQDAQFDVNFIAYYSIHRRVADKFREGRVVLAGDSAHNNNPTGGFGMNSGIHDARMLGETLAGATRARPLSAPTPPTLTSLCTHSSHPDLSVHPLLPP